MKKKYLITILIMISIFFGLVLTVNTSEAHILVIGDSINDNTPFYNEAKQLAADLKQRGYQVLEFYRGNATSENILKGMYDADAVIYVGHGGYQSGNYNNAGGTANPPFALLGSDNYIWGIGDKMREGWNGQLFYAPFKPKIPVILLHACFSTGWVNTYQVANPTETIYNFARMFTGSKANYYATAWNGAEIVYDFLNGAANFSVANNNNYEKITTSTLYNGVQVWRNTNGLAAFVGNWSGTFPLASQTTAYNEAAADAWYHSNRVRGDLSCSFFLNDSLYYINQPLTFIETSYDFGAQIISYFWDFGDGKNLTNNKAFNPPHIYTSPGNYVVKHIVTDNLNRVSQFNQTITVLSVLYVNSNSGNDSWDGSSLTWINGTIGPMKTISRAINAITLGGTIKVAPGTYTENLNISNVMNIVGNNSKNTIITAKNNQSAVVTINNGGSGSIIDGFKITGGSSGVNLSGANNCIIEDNEINGNTAGIMVQGNNNSISENNISNNAQGVYIKNGTQNTITENRITGSQDGVYCDGVNDNSIEDNTINDGTRGITAKNSKNLEIEENQIANNSQDGINFDNTTNSSIRGNEIRGNSQNGIKLKNSRNNSISGNTVRDNGQSNSGSGVNLQNSSNKTLNSNTVTGNYDGIVIQNNSNQNTVNNNKISAQNMLINISGSSGNTINNNQISFTLNQIITAANFVNTYIGTYYQLPSSVTINDNSLSMTQYLELLMTAALQINSGNTNVIPLRTFSNPGNPIDDIWAGNIIKSEYLKIANDLKIYMDTTGRSPDYQYGTTLGVHLGFQNLVYMFSKVLYVYKVANYLPNFVEMRSWSSITSGSAGIIPNGPLFTIDQIKDAASSLKNYVDSKGKLRDNITINGTTMNMAQFLELLMTATIQINNGNNNPIPLRIISTPSSPIDDIRAGNILKSEYLKIAGDLNGYMDTTARSPDYQYQTSLGKYLGFQNLVYMFSKVLDSYNSSSKLPDSVSMNPWKFVSSPTIAFFTVNQIKDAALTLKNYVETYSRLPDSITVNGTSVNMAQLLELLMTAILQINAGNNNVIPLKSYNNPSNPIDNIWTGVISKSEYLRMANDLKTYMDNTGRTPDYQYGTSVGTYLGFQNLVYTYSIILYVNKVANYLPDMVGMKPWSSITSGSAGIIPNGPLFTIDQIKDAASSLKNYVDSKGKLRDNITINGTTMNMAQFLELLMTATIQINNGNNNSIPLRTYSVPSNPIDDVQAGNILKTEYLKIANELKNYMDTTGRSPDYQYQTSIGKYLGFQNLVYMFSKVLDSYNSSSKLPDYALMGPWKFVSSPTIAFFTVNQIKDAAFTVKTSIESASKPPDNLNINGVTISMAQFLELMMTATLQIAGGSNGMIPLKNYTNPTNPIDDIGAGNIFQAEYLKIAGDLKAYMHSTGRSPDYQYRTTLGVHLGFQNLIFMFSKVLDYQKNNLKLPDYASMESWKFISSPTLATFNVSQIIDAAARVKSSIDNSTNIPTNVTINGTTVKMAQFLDLLMSALLQINNGSAVILLKSYSDPGNPVDNIRSGNIFKAEYLKIATDLKNYMHSTGRTPDYQYQTSIGTYLGFQNIIYMFCNVISFYKTANYLPDYTVMKPWRRLVYITSDNIVNTNVDTSRINAIISGLNALGLAAYNCGLGPNTHYSVLQNTGIPSNALIVDIYGGACAGTIYEMGTTYYKNLVGNRKVFSVWMPPAWDITGLAFLPRAHDDDFSPSWFTGLSNPDQYLKSNGYNYIYSGDLNTIISAIYKEAALA